MVDFVREAWWSRKEFKDLFDRPIKAGQHDESSTEEVRIMKRRAYTLTQVWTAAVRGGGGGGAQWGQAPRGGGRVQQDFL